MKELKIPALIENLGTVLDFITYELNGRPPKLIVQIEVVAEEIFANIASYAYGDAEGEVVVRVSADNEIIIEFEDCGMAYNPLKKTDPDITLGAKERKIGGLGIFMVKNMVDDINYRRNGDKNILTVKKRINA